VVANLSSGWIFTKLDIIVFLGALGEAFLSALLKQWNREAVQRKGFLYRFL
jgi:uncharacterized membrane protein